MFDLIARVLSGFYALPVVGGSYGIAIILLTIAVMIVLMPLTLRATRSTIKMQMVQPELQRIQKEFKADREQMNAELMTLYQEQGINPVGGCVPVLAQLPVFLVLFQVIRGLTRRVGESPFFSVANSARSRTGLPELDPEQFNPRYLDSDSQMYIDSDPGESTGDGISSLGSLTWANRPTTCWRTASSKASPTSSCWCSWSSPRTTSSVKSRPAGKTTANR